MRERPILFSAPMVRAILDGRKTQTRRVVRSGHVTGVDQRDCPYAVGQRLWVRETWCQQACMIHGDLLPGKAHYRADGYEVRHVDGPEKSPWRSPLFMPRWASRITLEVTGVRVERLQDITEEDACAEGCGGAHNWSPVDDYAALWDAINGKRAPWASNPWVWVVTFRRVER